MTTPAFAELAGLAPHDTLRAALKSDGITAPTPVQTASIGPILAGRNVLISAGTGTGKTLAYLLPVLQQLRETGGRAVVFAPGAELAMQTLRVAKAYAPDLQMGPAVATSSRKRQRSQLTKSTQLVVGTTDRLVELFLGGKLKGVGVLVFDEIEPILASKAAPGLHTLLSRSEPVRQLVVATATMGQSSEAFVARFLGPDVVMATGGERVLDEQITHRMIAVPGVGDKEGALIRFVRGLNGKQAIVFGANPKLISRLFHVLSEREVAVATLSRDRTKAQRRQALDGFRSGAVQVLLTTDAGARGLDVPGIDWVVHVDLPRSPEAYVHRAGRTGRAGRQGTSVAIADPGMQRDLQGFCRTLGITLERG